MEFESHAGKEVALEVIFLCWYPNCFDDAKRQMDIFEPLGITPHIVWMPFFTPSKRSDVLLDIIDGKQDAIIDEMAQKCASYGKPIFMRFAHEMNGTWYPWSGPSCGAGVSRRYGSSSIPDGPEKYIDAFRYVKNKFDATGATNVIWVWSPNADSVPGEDWNQLTNYYPGDDYVDWVGVDFYGLFWGDGDPYTQIGKVYNYYADRKPIMLAETAAADQDNYGGGGWPTTLTKPEWISEFFFVMETYYPRVKAFNWFNENKIEYGEADWRIESTPYPDSQDTYAICVSNPRYLSALEGGEGEVNPPPVQNSKVHIFDIQMSVKRRGKSSKYTSSVKVVVKDENDNLVDGAKVEGDWLFNEDFLNSSSGYTDSCGEVYFNSDNVSATSGTFTFKVKNVTKDGFIYESTGDIESEDSINF